MSCWGNLRVISCVAPALLLVLASLRRTLRLRQECVYY